MKTLQIKAYTFEELSPEAKAIALDNYRDLNVDHEWYKYTIDDWKERLSEDGYLDADIHFSGFGSQGDGASFTAQMDLVKWISSRPQYTELLPLIEEGDITAIIKRTSRQYSHKNTCSAEVEVDYHVDKTEVNVLASALEDELEEDRIRLCEELYRELGQEYDYLTSDEAVAETITINEYLFTAEGERSAIL